MLRRAGFQWVELAISLGIVAACSSADAVLSAEPGKTRAVSAGEIKLAIPEAWEQQPTTSKLRLAQFVVPKAEGDPENAEFVVFFFGGTAGGVDANAERWIKQFQPKDRKVKLTSGKCPQGEYVLVDLRGTYLKPIGPPIQQKTVEMAKARMLGVILTVKGQGNYFLRLAGPDKTTSANVDALRTAIGGDAKSEKEYKRAEEN